MFRVIVRTPAEKADPERSWARPDEDFFGSGACHVLAGVFLDAYPCAGFRPLMIQPAADFRGGHVIVTNGSVVFDCRGWSSRDQFLKSYSGAMRALFPGWTYSLVAIDNPCGWDSCRLHDHRHPSQFYRDPMPRARAFLKRFPPAPFSEEERK